MDKNTHYLLGKRVAVHFPHDGYRGGIDPVFLAAFTPVRGKILDLGCGVGTAGLCLKHRAPAVDVTFFDRDMAALEATQHNLKLNGFDGVIKAGDVRDKDALPRDYFDGVLLNPPYFEAGTYFKDATTKRESTNHEGESGATLADWLSCANRVCHAKGVITLIQRAERLDDILAFFHEKNITALDIFPLWPKRETPAKLVLVRAHKGIKRSVHMMPGLVLHTESGDYTTAAQAVLYDAKPLA